MRVAGCNVPYRNVIKCALQPRVGPTKLRTFKTTTYNGHDRASLPPNYLDLVEPNLPPPNPYAKEIAILGGGLTGLATAFHIARQLPNAKIAIFEKSNRLGGWVDSEVIEVDDGEVLFEWGPRTIRSGLGHTPMSMLELVAQLDLDKDLVAIPKSSPAARSRYIYYPDHLVKLPVPLNGSSLSELFQNVKTVLTEPLYDGIWNCLKESWAPVREKDVNDESLGDFVSRRFGKEVVDNLLSAVGHGIYAGDIYKLSARTLQPQLWHLETRKPEELDEEPGILLQLLHFWVNRFRIGPTSLLQHTQRKTLSMRSQDTYLKRVPNLAVFKDLSVYTFRHGLGQLTSALEQDLRKNKNITIIESTTVEEVTFSKDRNQLSVRRKPSRTTAPATYDYVVSTLAPRQMQQFFLSNKTRNLDGAVDPKLTAACEHSNVSVNVMVINLYYRNPNLLPPSTRGFGYLIPRSVPVEQNPERALGVIFSSETSGKFEPLDRRSTPLFANSRYDEKVGEPVIVLPEGDEQPDGPEVVAQDTAPGTKLTVMMGGHWWSEWDPSDIPSEEQAIEMAQTLLRRHINIQESPAVAKARLNRNCIPQYPVGYAQDMATIHDALSSMYQGRLKVAGSWWQGAPGMNDCVRSASEAAFAIRDQRDEHTGLQDYMHESWVVTHVPTRQSKVEYTR